MRGAVIFSSTADFTDDVTLGDESANVIKINGDATVFANFMLVGLFFCVAAIRWNRTVCTPLQSMT